MRGREERTAYLDSGAGLAELPPMMKISSDSRSRTSLFQIVEDPLIQSFLMSIKTGIVEDHEVF